MSYSYALVANSSSVQRSDGALIPDDARNLDWQAYQAWVASGNMATPVPAPTSAQAAASNYANAIAAGLAVASASTPALNATYGVDPTAQANITAIVTGIAAGLGLPGGGSSFTYLDATGGPHAMTQTQFIALAQAIRGYVYALDLYLAGQGAQPAASATIA